MKVAAVAWDIDGTLVDSEPTHLQALKAACAQHGIDLTGAPDFTGVNLPNAWEALGERVPAGLDRERWENDINSFYVASAASIEPMPGAVETVRAIDRADMPQVAVSNSNRIIVDTNLRVIGLHDVIRWSLSLDDVARGKPDPLPYRLAADHLGLRPEAMVAVEDSATGVAAARAAGMMVIGIAPSGARLTHAHETVSDLAAITGILSLSPPT